mmetsp:Transcript_56648/g.164293  ORF Transcript_56648/g.164293 Transcript_56648/m.164293 type:complete len:201 (+) Transcript_56648:316-918(+)
MRWHPTTSPRSSRSRGLRPHWHTQHRRRRRRPRPRRCRSSRSRHRRPPRPPTGMARGSPPRRTSRSRACPPTPRWERMGPRVGHPRRSHREPRSIPTEADLPCTPWASLPTAPTSAPKTLPARLYPRALRSPETRPRHRSYFERSSVRRMVTTPLQTLPFPLGRVVLRASPLWPARMRRISQTVPTSRREQEGSSAETAR